LKLYVISDTHIQNQFSHLELAHFAKQAGVSYFQYREKKFVNSIHFHELVKIRELLKNSNTKLIINDDLDLALEIQADGVHVGQEDLSLEVIFQKKLPLNFIVGATVHNEKELKQVSQYPIHYIGMGPIFGTQSKKMSLPPLGIDGLKKLLKQTQIPVFAIGNIQFDNYKFLQFLPLEGIVLLSAFVLSENPHQTLEQWKSKLSITEKD